ncbi:MAG TPA: DUF4388 domain-containing protein [Kofleriaceae bacterium]
MLIVADSPRLGELVGMLGEPLSAGVATVLVSSGGDDTIELFSQKAPHVVVVTATLDAGDTAALIGALRGMLPRAEVGFVLVGDDDGPVRTVLDAGEMAPDRFVARPLTTDAFRFAVNSVLEAVLLIRSTAEASRGTLVPIAQAEDDARAARLARWDAMADSMVDADAEDKEEERSEAAPLPPPLVIRPRRPSEAPVSADEPWKPGTTAALDHDSGTEWPEAVPPAAENPARRSWSEMGPPTREPTLIIRDPDPPASSPGTLTSSPPPMNPFAGSTHPGATPPPRPPAPSATRSGHASPDAPIAEGVPHVIGADYSGGTSSGMRRDSSGPIALDSGRARSDSSAPITRPRSDSSAPITSSGTQPDRPRSDSQSGSQAGRARSDSQAGDGGDWISRMPLADMLDPNRPVRRSGDADDLLADLPDDLIPSMKPGAVRSSSTVPEARGVTTEVPIPSIGTVTNTNAGGANTNAGEMPSASDLPGADVPGGDAPGGRDFARQLRAKMANMAQRLFQGGAGEAAQSRAVDISPKHDHHTEIDLASLGEEPALDRGVTEIEARADRRSDIRLPVPGSVSITSPGTWDTAVRERGLPNQGEIVRGLSDPAMLLAKMFAQESTGRVVFRREDVEKVVYFDVGRPVFAASSVRRDRMGELLVREGKITAAQYDRCQTAVAESGRRIGEILVDLGYLKRRELLPAVRRHVEDIVYSLFGWDRGTYHIIPETAASVERIRLSRHPAALILEGVRRKWDRASLERLIGSASTVIEVPDREKLGGIINLNDLAPEERAALAAFDGQSDLAAVARTANVDVTDILPLAWGLCILGLASARRTDTEVHDESSALVGETDIAIDRERVRARWQLVSEADYFALLGVRRDATGFEIRRAYQAARRDFAADGFPNDLRRELAQELDDIAHVLDEAFRVLRDDRLRLTYLSNLIE